MQVVSRERINESFLKFRLKFDDLSLALLFRPLSKEGVFFSEGMYSNLHLFCRDENFCDGLPIVNIPEDVFYAKFKTVSGRYKEEIDPKLLRSR